MTENETPYQKEVIKPGDRASQYAKEICYQSHANCPAVIVVPHAPGNFRAPVGFLWRKGLLREMTDYAFDGNEVIWSLMEEVENDGAGGKPQLFTLAGTKAAFWNLGWEPITMTVDDFARSGRLAAVMANEIQLKHVNDSNWDLLEHMLAGFGAALRKARIVNITGEVAVMKHSITAFCDTGDPKELILTWGATCIGLARKELLIDGRDIKRGMDVIGFWEPGYRCNGGTRLTGLVLECFGPEIAKIKANSVAMEFVQKLTTPSLSYARTICRMIGWKPDGSYHRDGIKIAGIAHITGGGLWEKFGELLPPGLGAHLFNLPRPADVLLQAQDMSFQTDQPISDWEAYSTFPGGCGMLLVADPMYSEAILNESAKDGIEASIVGKIEETKDVPILLHSQFLEGGVLDSNQNRVAA